MDANTILAAKDRRSGVIAATGHVDFSQLLILVVDAVPDMRSAMAMTLNAFGATKVEFSSRISEALGRIQHTQYDVILADYSLGHDYDGIHLFEEIKKRNLIKQSCVYFIVTSERRSQMVMGAVELVPDDYLIKPFTGQLLAERLEKAIRKKKEFECVDDAVLNHQYLRAIEECNRRIKSNDPFVLDFLKLKGRLALLTGDFASARDMYQGIVNSKELPWAKLGLAKSLYHLNDLEGSERLFGEVLAYNDRVMEAYDWLARLYTKRQDNVKAQAALQKAISISPWIVTRQKQLGEVAHRNKALNVAEEAYKKTITIAKNSFWREAGDYASLARVQMENKNFAAAHATVNEVRKEFSHEPKAQMLSFAIEAMVFQQSGDRVKAQAALSEAEKRFEELKDVPDDYSLELAQACFVNGKGDKATELVRSVVKNNHENIEIISRVTDLYEAIGRPEEGETLVRETAGDIVDINNRAVRMAQEGDFDGAVELFLRAVDEMPNNVQILLNSINALLAYVNTKGWHESYMQLVARYLDRAKAIDRASSKYQKLQQLMLDTKRRYGMK